MTIINNDKAQAIEATRKAQADLAQKLKEIGTGHDFFADLIVITDTNDKPVAIVRLDEGLIEKQEVVLPSEAEVSDAVELLLKKAQ